MTGFSARYHWRGTDRQGRVQRGQMMAAHGEQVRLLLHRQGISATRVALATTLAEAARPDRSGPGSRPEARPRSGPDTSPDAETRSKPGPGPMSGPRIKAFDITLLTQQTANMVKAGLPLLQALTIVAAGSEHQRVRHLLSALRDRIATGGSFSEALAEHPGHFNCLFVSLVSIGEHTGTLATALERVATCRQRDDTVIRQVKKAMTYPLAVLATAIAVTAVLLIKVVPQFAATFADLGAPLPALTQSVLALSDLVIRFGWLWLILVTVTVFGSCHLVRTHSGAQLLFHRLLICTPALGALLSTAALARICRTLATTVAAGLPIMEALKLSADAAGNRVYERACLDIIIDIEQGQSLAFSIRKTNLFPVMMTQLTNAGEESGTLDTMLERCADHYERSVNDLLEGLTGLLEPLIMAMLGLFVGGLMVAMYLPIFRLGAVL